MTQLRCLGVDDEVTQKRKRDLLFLVHGAVYAQRKSQSSNEWAARLKCPIDEKHTQHLFFSSHEMVVHLNCCGHWGNRNRAQRQARSMGLGGKAPAPDASLVHHHHVAHHFPHGTTMARFSKMWSTDTICIRLTGAYTYPEAIIDRYSLRMLRRVTSNTMVAVFCVDRREDAMQVHRNTHVCKSDKGTQFSNGPLAAVLKNEAVTICTHERRSAFDNIFVESTWLSVKNEVVHLHAYFYMYELLIGMTEYFRGLQRRDATPGVEISTRRQCIQARRGCKALNVRKYEGQAETLWTRHCASPHVVRAPESQDIERVKIVELINRSSAAQLCEFRGDINYHLVCLGDGVCICSK